MRGHLLARAAVDDQRFRAEPTSRARGIHGGVAAAINRDAAADLRRLAIGLHALQKLQRVVDLAGVACRDLLTPAEVGADGDEHRIESSGGLLQQQVFDLVVQDDLDAEVFDAFDFRIEHFTRQPVFRDAEVHHPARHRTRFMNDRGVAQKCQVPRGRQPARPCADRPTLAYPISERAIEPSSRSQALRRRENARPHEC